MFYHCSAHELTVTLKKGVKSGLTAVFEFEIFYCSSQEPLRSIHFLGMFSFPFVFSLFATPLLSSQSRVWVFSCGVWAGARGGGGKQT